MSCSASLEPEISSPVKFHSCSERLIKASACESVLLLPLKSMLLIAYEREPWTKLDSFCLARCFRVVWRDGHSLKGGSSDFEFATQRILQMQHI